MYSSSRAQSRDRLRSSYVLCKSPLDFARGDVSECLIEGFLMESLIKSLLFRLNPETAHYCAMTLLQAYAQLPSMPTPNENTYKSLGLSFANRVGLAAGFDKNAQCLAAWQKLGFGFAEVGTVTALPQTGNPKPRVFRYTEEKALLNRMGFNNDGCERIAERIAMQRNKHKITIPIGINIGKSKLTPLEDAASDYKKSFLTLADHADYMVVNVSSPNTPGLRNLQSTELLKPLLDVLCTENSKRVLKRPLLVKLSPDLNIQDFHHIADLALEFQLQGLIVSNTSTDFSIARPLERYGQGGISGKPLFEKSTECLKAIHSHIGKKLVLIASGGVMSGDDAKLKIEAGADLVQVYTGFIYEGPRLVREIATQSLLR